MEGLLLGVHDKLCWCLYRLETNCLSRIILEKLLASISRSEGLEGDCLYNAATHSIVPPPPPGCPFARVSSIEGRD